MPIYNQTYSSWDGQLMANPKPWWLIAKTGIGKVFQKWMIILLVFSSFQFVFRLFQIVAMSYVGEKNPFQNMNIDLDINNHFFNSFLSGQGFFLLLVILFAGADLISRDRSLNALPLYFSRPVGFHDYVLGKWLIVAFFSALVTLVPALILFTVQLAFSQNSIFLQSYYWIPLALLGDWILQTLVMGGLILALSALVKGARSVLVFIFLIYFPEMIRVIFSRIPELGLFSIKAGLKQAEAFFFQEELPYEFSVWIALLLFLILAAISYAILRWRVKPVEIVK